MNANHIRTVRDIQGMGHRDFVARNAQRMRLIASGKLAARPPLSARIEQGRWLVHCPFCAGAELADREDPVFFCLSCGNAKAGGDYLAVGFPDNADAIERALLDRPNEENRNWLGESVRDLQRETAAHLLGDS